MTDSVEQAPEGAGEAAVRRGPTRPAVSVIVPHYDDPPALALCLEALERQTFSEPIEIVVADNNSRDLEAVRAVVGSRAKLVVVTERGAGPARNGAVAVSQGEILAFTDCDCVPEPQWLAEGVALLGRYDFVGGAVKVLVGDPKRPTPVEAFERVFAFDMKRYALKLGFAGSGNLFVSRRVFEDVGGFKAAVSEDTEWSHRATAAGYRLGYSDTARVGHPARRTWAELVAKWRRVNRENLALADERGSRLRWIAKTLLLPASIVAHVPKILFSRELNGARQRWDACLTLARIRLWRLGDSIAALMASRRS